MQISARNTFCGKVGAVLPGAVNDEIEIILPGGEKIIAIVTRESVRNLGLW
ncbi:MAG: TOBE domain-containing protein, partial [Desulfovibrionaceae bacterium]|nr:TOBE domain-containing protein [Desulfovibrionaceae bacterium]